SRQKRCHPERWKLCEASSRSFGTLRMDWYILKVMFQAWLVKIANTQASSPPNTLPGNKFMKKTTVKVRKPRIGTDCRISSSGISTISARRAFCAQGAEMEGEKIGPENSRRHP